jgi:hypothetical protein
MKLFAIFALFFVALDCRAQENRAVTSKVAEHDRNKDGKPDVRLETFYRGAQKVMLVLSHQNAQGVMAATERSYLVGGDMITTESDEDRDGVFETIAVYRPGTDDMDVFKRQADGSVKPVDAQTLAAHKKQNVAIKELWDKAFDKDMDGEKFLDRMKEARKKIRDAEKEKTDGKK